jgi:hypothetical protein
VFDPDIDPGLHLGWGVGIAIKDIRIIGDIWK